MGRDHEHRQVSIVFDSREGFHHLETVHVRHLEIEQDQVVAVLAVKLANRARIACRRHRYVSRAAQHALEEEDIRFLIVDDEDLGPEDVGGIDHGVALGRRACSCAKSKAESRLAMNSMTLIGLVRYEKKPASRPFSISRGMAFALRASTGMCAVSVSSRRIFSASKPLMPGRLMSIRITSGWFARASWMPMLPSRALRRRMVGRRAMSCSTSFKLAGLSST